MTMIKRRSMAAALAVVLCHGAASAQVVTISPAELASLANQLRQLKDQYDQLVRTYNTLAHLNPKALLTGQGLENDAMRLPGSAASAIPGLNFGKSLTSAGQSQYDQNHVYTPHGNDWAAQEMQRRQVATANIQGEAQTGMQRAQQRLASLTELENSIPQQPDVQAVSAMNARINSEKMYLANEGNNVQRLQLLAQTQTSVDEQRIEQHNRQQLDDYGASLSQRAWGG